jgi:hypothetical protein
MGARRVVVRVEDETPRRQVLSDEEYDRKYSHFAIGDPACGALSISRGNGIIGAVMCCKTVQVFGPELTALRIWLQDQGF